MLEQLETDDPPVDDVDEDLESSKADDDVGDLDLADEESADELDYDEDDDSPIARPEFGKWPSKSIREVRLDVTETGTEAPQDRANASHSISKTLRWSDMDRPQDWSNNLLSRQEDFWPTDSF